MPSYHQLMLIDRKRKITDDVDSEGPIRSTIQLLSVPELCITLAECPPSKVIKSLIEGLKNATPQQVSAVQSVLAPLLAASVQPLHCVRCHEEYFESNNTDSSCDVKHKEAEDDEEIVIEDSWKKAMYTYPCCGKRVAVGMGWELDEDEVCHTTLHTTNPDEVDYEVPGLETCESAGCVSDSGDSDDFG
ncbi:hypothetical protein FRC09_014363 [Ceratobasidium sp. 395]|nr:hypothetical protein FRC09_014363 [Ceratobasidium sp. 395]